MERVPDVAGNKKVMSEEIVELPLDKIDLNPRQVRTDASSEERSDDHEEGTIEDLAASMRLVGLVQPITVVPSGNGSGRYEVVVGERRVRAARFLGWEKIRAIVQTSARSELERKVMELVENTQRRRLSWTDKARRVAEVVGHYRGRKSQKELAQELGIPQSKISVYATVGAAEDRWTQAGIEEGLFGDVYTAYLFLSLPDDVKSALLARAMSRRKKERSITRAEVEAAKSKAEKTARLESDDGLRRGRRGSNGVMVPLRVPFDLAMVLCQELDVDVGDLEFPEGNEAATRKQLADMEARVLRRLREIANEDEARE